MGSKKQHTYKIQAEGVDIEVRYGGLKGDYFSLTDMARYRNADNAGFVIQNWMRNRNVIRFLGLWERLNTLISITSNSRQLKRRQVSIPLSLPPKGGLNLPMLLAL